MASVIPDHSFDLSGPLGADPGVWTLHIHYDAPNEDGHGAACRIHFAGGEIKIPMAAMSAFKEAIAGLCDRMADGADGRVTSQT